MKTPLHSCLSVFLASVILAGCQGMPLLQQTTLSETEFFAKGLDQYAETGDLQTLKRLPQQFPEGEWGSRAELVVKLVEQQEKFATAKTGKLEKQALLKDQELALCHNETAVLRENNLDLEKTIAQLKKLLIEMESRSN